MQLRPRAAALVCGCGRLDVAQELSKARPTVMVSRSPLLNGHACLFICRRPSLPAVNNGNQPAIRAFFADLDEEARDLAERLAHGDDESVWAWFERRYPKATKRAAKGRHWREFVRAIREFYGDETPLQ